MTSWSKPLLMPSLALGLFFILTDTDKKTPFIKTLFAGLAFSTAGDVLLQLEKSSHLTIYFYLGLGAFLLAQWMYVLTFRRIGPINISMNWSLIYIFYFIQFLAILYPGMPLALKIPVTLYGMMLTVMAWNSWRCVQEFPLGFSAVIGAILFVASDSLLAINKFKTPIPYAGILIMATYIFAQYFIVVGVRSRLE
ncbi:MAG: lysoplasmalogenase [Saprospiraceae bacterium]